jgi:hypothetical protein
MTEMNLQASAVFPSRKEALAALQMLSTELGKQPGFAGFLDTTNAPTITITIGIYDEHVHSRKTAWSAIMNAFQTTNLSPLRLELCDTPVEAEPYDSFATGTNATQVTARPSLMLELIRLGWAMTTNDFVAHLGLTRETYDSITAGGEYQAETVGQIAKRLWVEPWELLELTDAQRALFLRLGRPSNLDDEDENDEEDES